MSAVFRRINFLIFLYQSIFHLVMLPFISCGIFLREDLLLSFCCLINHLSCLQKLSLSHNNPSTRYKFHEEDIVSIALTCFRIIFFLKNLPTYHPSALHEVLALITSQNNQLLRCLLLFLSFSYALKLGELICIRFLHL